MAKKALAPRLPKNPEDLEQRGFVENVSASRQFITDGHGLLLREMVKDKKLVSAVTKGGVHSVPEEKIAAVWNQVAKRDHVAVAFIGCGQVEDSTNVLIPVAVMRDPQNRVLLCDPYKLAFLVLATGADTLTVDAGKEWKVQPLALSRGETMVDMLMPMRYFASDLKAYDLKAAQPVPLDKAFVEKEVEVRK